MAGSQSFGKRENEKKKQAKRLEKQRSKEARRAEGTSSFEEMIAWVDEHGNLTDVPPEERARKAQEVKLEDIVISTPKKTEVDITAAPAEIAEGRTVTFELERSARGMNATHIVFADQKN